MYGLRDVGRAWGGLDVGAGSAIDCRRIGRALVTCIAAGIIAADNHADGARVAGLVFIHISLAGLVTNVQVRIPRQDEGMPGINKSLPFFFVSKASQATRDKKPE